MNSCHFIFISARVSPGLERERTFTFFLISPAFKSELPFQTFFYVEERSRVSPGNDQVEFLILPIDSAKEVP